MFGLYIKEAVNTMNAGWFELKLAKIFGKKSKHVEYDVTVKLSKFRGKIYLVGVVSNDPH